MKAICSSFYNFRCVCPTVYLEQVKYASVKQSAFGYTTNDRQAIRAKNTADLVVEGMRLGGGVQSIEKDAATNVTVRYSDPVQIRLIQ